MIALAALVLPRGLLIALGLVIVLGHGIGPWFAAEGATRRRRLVTLRALNVYGDQPWTMQPDLLHTMMSVLNLTKYPPSA